MRLSFILPLLAINSGSAFSSVPLYVDTLFINAQVHQVDQADAVAVSDGRIASIGTRQQLSGLVTSDTQVIDLEGGYLLPGFIDNHNHVFEAASEAGGQCELSMDAGLEQQLPYLQQCKQLTSREGWVMGYGFSIDAILSESNQRSPLEVLDEVFPDQPVIFMEQTSHAMWVNSQALQLAKFTSKSPDPVGGKILRDDGTGQLTGILLDNAGDIVMELAWNSLEEQFDKSYEGLMNGLYEAKRHGITTIGDGRLYWKRGWFQVWKEVEKRGDLSARVSLRPWIYPTDSIESQLPALEAMLRTDRSKRILIDQVKMYSDGILINGTAKTLAPYLRTYIPESPYGLNYIAPELMKTWLIELDKIGYGAHIHAIGDGAIHESLNAIQVARQQGSEREYTLTHVELIDSKDTARFYPLNVAADFQVGSDYVAYQDHQWAEALIGAQRAHALMNLKKVFDTGANVTLSSDWNVHDINPLVGIANSLLMGNSGLPDIDSAIDAYTINAATSLGIEDMTGSIEVGKSADFVILDRDITQLSAEAIKKTQVWLTVLEGEVVYQAE
ncbi:amidohydrolase [Vibrio atypicus]|uniref:amidohydrolase n=1 Tax=Vibrio atypicus TaxID=558271 RepID=UPI0037356B3F